MKGDGFSTGLAYFWHPGFRMWSLLFSCPNCGLPPSRKNFPLCSSCKEALITAPLFSENDQFAQRDFISSYHARYLLAGPGYGVLKKWKTGHGHFFDAQILNLLHEQKETLEKLECRFIVPIPQTPKRALRLGGSPVLKIGQWLSHELKLSLLEGFCLRSHRGPRQAERSLHERMEHRFPFELAPPSEKLFNENVLLIDDFITTGRTIRAAAQLLAKAGVRSIHVFSLGVRPKAHRSDDQT